MRSLAAALAIVGALSGQARATVALCLEVRAEEPSFRKLVEDELSHHPTHRIVQSGCESLLTVELFGFSGARYLTARVNQEVPVRFAVKTTRDIEERLTEALRQVLQHDPAYLAEDLSRMNAVMRAGANVVKNGTNRYRLELYEIFGSGGRNPVFASGASFAVTRGIDHAQVFARLSAAGMAGGLDQDVTLKVLAGGEIGALYEVSARGNVTFYIGPGAALHYLRFEGKQMVQNIPVEQTPANVVLFSLAIRAGVRVLRFYNVDVDLFAQLHLPFYKSRDPDSPLMNDYTPYAAVGLGVGF
jgi:hypothetical protein